MIWWWYNDMLRTWLNTPHRRNTKCRSQRSNCGSPELSFWEFGSAKDISQASTGQSHLDVQVESKWAKQCKPLLWYIFPLSFQVHCLLSHQVLSTHHIRGCRGEKEFVGPSSGRSPLVFLSCLQGRAVLVDTSSPIESIEHSFWTFPWAGHGAVSLVRLFHGQSGLLNMTRYDQCFGRCWRTTMSPSGRQWSLRRPGSGYPAAGLAGLKTAEATIPITVRQRSVAALL